MENTPFADVDRMPAAMATMLIAALEAMSRHPEIRRIRRTGRRALRPAPGQRLLDAGCGGGDVARELAREVEPGGSVLALDHSAVTLGAARQRHDGSAVQYATGDVAALDLPDDGVDGVWCERVLQHLADPDAAIGEFARVTRPGGRICLIDTDWDSLAFDGPRPELSAAVVQHTTRQFTRTQLDMGRSLRRRLGAAGCTDVETRPMTCYFGTPESAAVVLPMVNPMVPADVGVWPAGLRETWFADVAQAGARGDFLAALTIWVAVGVVPAGC